MAKKPKYKLHAKCSKLRWDEIRNRWWCCQTSVCYKHSDQCPLCEGVAREVQKGSYQLNTVFPMSIRNGAERWINLHKNHGQLSFNF